MKRYPYILAATLLFFALLSSCKGDDAAAPTQAEKKIVETRLKFGSTYGSHALYLSAQGTSINGGLSPDFNFIGLETQEEGSIIHEASVIKTATYSSIPSDEVRFKTSEPVSTLSVAIAAPYQIFVDPNTPTMNFTIEFYLDGKKVASASENPFPSNSPGKVYVFDVSDPENIIVSYPPSVGN
ncbi:hypothetical protein [Sphingobacterium bambusae]|uniref:DUF1735 domain-containing protein n=1 Tax=Sphingobacterium bambusae TaxID=662858 RepID=A0ABW6BDE5_9SPHI|nr:hypothetical protein [Sphingobacterium bambusae]WPL48469.1 hypothetical protein SCB77_21200 [Sphingobacterium bambusae]